MTRTRKAATKTAATTRAPRAAKPTSTPPATEPVAVVPEPAAPVTPEPEATAPVTPEADVAPEATPEASAAPEAATEATEAAGADPAVEVKAEVPFGEDPDDLDGADDADAHGGSGDGPSSVGATTTLTYRGLAVAEGAKADPGPVAVIFAAPRDHKQDYERITPPGARSYTLHRDRPTAVAEEDADWILGYPAYVVEAEDDKQP